MNSYEENKRKVMAVLYGIMTTGIAVVIMTGAEVVVCSLALFPIGQECVIMDDKVVELFAKSSFGIASKLFSIASGVGGYIIAVKGKLN